VCPGSTIAAIRPPGPYSTLQANEDLVESVERHYIPFLEIHRDAVLHARVAMNEAAPAHQLCTNKAMFDRYEPNLCALSMDS